MNIAQAIKENKAAIGVLIANGPNEWWIVIDSLQVIERVTADGDIIIPFAPFYKITNPELIPSELRSIYLGEISGGSVEGIPSPVLMTVVISGQFNENTESTPEVTIEECMHVMELIIVALTGGLMIGTVGGAAITGVTALALHYLLK